jgi:hypothetical protein
MDVFRWRRKTAKDPKSRKAKTVAVRPQLRERLILPHANWSIRRVQAQQTSRMNAGGAVH